jgi:hypothetical protein
MRLSRRFTATFSVKRKNNEKSSFSSFFFSLFDSSEYIEDLSNAILKGIYFNPVQDRIWQNQNKRVNSDSFPIEIYIR